MSIPDPGSSWKPQISNECRSAPGGWHPSPSNPIQIHSCTRASTVHWAQNLIICSSVRNNLWEIWTLWWHHHSQEGQWLNSNTKVKLRMFWHTKCCAVLLYAILCSTPHGIDPPYITCLGLTMPLFRCSLQNWVVPPDHVWLMWKLELLSTIHLRALLFLPPKRENRTVLPCLGAQLWV